MSEKLSERSDMSDAVLAAKLIREVVSVDAAPTIAKRIQKTARKLGWSYYRTRDVWQEQARRIDAFEMDQLRIGKVTRQLQEARRAHAELTALIAGMEATLSSIDEDFHRPTIDRLRESLSGASPAAGGVGRAGDRGAVK